MGGRASVSRRPQRRLSVPRLADPVPEQTEGDLRAAVQRGPAALSIQTSIQSPYDDVETNEGFFYDYRAGPIDLPDNKALRAAAQTQVPVVYFFATRPNLYRPLYPYFVTEDFPREGRVICETREADRADGGARSSAHR
jgi:hypothetical protein